VLPLMRCAPPLLMLLFLVSLEAVDRGGVVLFHDLLVVGLIEAVVLYELACRGELGLMQDGGLRMLKGRVHIEVELGRLVLPVVHHLVHPARHVARVGTRVTCCEDRLHFL
jgi:hypothetical protein